jgi:hypothetical protein
MRHAVGVAIAAIGRAIAMHAGELRREHAQQGKLPPGEALGDKNREIAALTPRSTPDAILVGRGDRHDFGHRIERRAQVLAEGRNDDDAEVLLVLGDDPAGAVVDGAARGRGELHARAVLFGKQAIFRRVQDLQLAQTPKQKSEQPRLRDADQNRAAREALAQPDFRLRLAVRPPHSRFDDALQRRPRRKMAAEQRCVIFRRLQLHLHLR